MDPTDVKLHGLVDVAVLLLNGLIVGNYRHGEFVVLGVCGAQHNLNRPDVLGLLGRLAQLEIVDIAVVHVFEDLQFFAVSRKQDTLPIQIPNGAAQVFLGFIQIFFGRRDIGFGPRQIGRHLHRSSVSFSCCTWPIWATSLASLLC